VDKKSSSHHGRWDGGSGPGEVFHPIEGVDFEFAENNGGRWPNVTELPMSWDCCDYVNSNITTGWAIFLLCSNNAGGNIYYVPQKLWTAARLAEHMEVHNKAWSSNANNS
jgi:hypothetical protein